MNKNLTAILICLALTACQDGGISMPKGSLWSRLSSLWNANEQTETPPLTASAAETPSIEIEAQPEQNVLPEVDDAYEVNDADKINDFGSKAKPPVSSGNAQLNREMDADLVQMKRQLPMQIGDIMKLVSVARKGTTIEYVYQFTQDGVSRATFNVEQGKRTGAQQLCSNPATRRFVDAGYVFNFKYKFTDGSNVAVPLKASDCY